MDGVCDTFLNCDTLRSSENEGDIGYQRGSILWTDIFGILIQHADGDFPICMGRGNGDK